VGAENQRANYDAFVGKQMLLLMDNFEHRSGRELVVEILQTRRK